MTKDEAYKFLLAHKVDRLADPDLRITINEAEMVCSGCGHEMHAGDVYLLVPTFTLDATYPKTDRPYINLGISIVCPCFQPILSGMARIAAGYARATAPGLKLKYVLGQGARHYGELLTWITAFAQDRMGMDWICDKKNLEQANNYFILGGT
jgi:hypothetical protein